jgi:predicted nucleic acid-binding protein
MAEINKVVVVDASVVLSWLLPDEKITGKSNKLYEKYVVGEVRLLAPDLLWYEVVNGIRSAVVRKRINKKIGKEAVVKFSELGLEFKDQSGVFGKVLEISLKYDLSIYDASYVALAKEVGSKLFTFDKGILKNVGEVVFKGNV